MNDLRFAFRQLLKHRGFTAVAVLTLALGIGATTTVFSVIDAVLLSPLPYRNSERMVHVWERNLQIGMESANTSPQNFADWRKESQSFDALAFSGEFAGNLSQSFIITGDSAATRLRGRFVSSDFFRVFAVEPILGRAFLPEEDERAGDRVVILSHNLWQNRFAGDPNIIGKTILLDNFGRHSYHIVGVMPQGFDYPGCSVWIPAGHMHRNFAYRGAKSIHVIGRLKAGVTLESAEAELSTVQQRIAAANPELKQMGTQVKLLSFHESTVRSVRPSLLLFGSAVILVLLIACANAANLLLARAVGRRREMAIRSALGAGRWRIVRQLLAESVVLALAGGTLGTLLAIWGSRLVVHFHGGSIPRALEIGIDLRALGFTLLVSTLTGLLFGLAPAWLASQTDFNDALKEGSQQVAGSGLRNWLFNAFTIVEVGLALMLLIGAGLLIQSFVRLQHVELGFDTANVLTVDVDMAGASYKSDAERRVFFRQLLERLRAVPGIEAACGVSMIPDRGQGWTTPVWRTDRPTPPREEWTTVGVRPVTPGFLATYGIGLLRGREFTESDTTTSPRVVMVNKAFADRYFPNEDPVGKHIHCEAVQEIIGVVADVKNAGLEGNTKPEVYGSYQQWYWPSAFLTVRTKSNSRALISVITREVHAINPDQPLMYFKTMEQFITDTTARPRFRSVLVAFFAATALVLACVGIYGVMAYSVNQRTQEMGVRLALGAQKSDVLLLILRRGMRLTLFGVLLGLAGSFALTRLLSNQLFGVTATDPGTFVGVALLLMLVSVAACLVPARRAASIDPIEALRHE